MVREHTETQVPVTNRIITAVAEKEGVDETELPPLYETIDPSALETLFRDGSGKVSFEYSDYLVTVDHQHTVEVEPVDTQ